MKKTVKYSGVVVPVVTPLTKSYQLDHRALGKMISNFKKHNVMPFILGTTGESSSLSIRFKQGFVKKAGKLKSKDMILYAGISSNCVEESVLLAKTSFDSGADVVVASLPSFYLLSDDEMKKYFEQLANQVKGPLIIYNIPAATHMSIPLNIVDELSHHENIVGIKDSERDEERLLKSLSLWSTREDFSHLTGWAAKSVEALMNGSDGLVPSTANLYPQVYVELYNAVRNDENEKAYKLQKLSDIIGNVYQTGNSLGTSLWALKVLLNEAGLCESYVMPPIQPLSVEEGKALRKNWQELIAVEGIEL